MKADIGRVLQRLGIEAKKKGREWYAKCPNKEHDDHSPSWRIRDDPQSEKHGYHKCWPCGFQGSVLGLIEHVLGLEDRTAARAWLEENEAVVRQERVDDVEVTVKAQRLRFRLPREVKVVPVDQWPKPARDYLKKRGIEEWQVDRWGIGYAASGKLAGRIVIVSRDRAGKPLRYTARTFVDADKRYIEPDPHEGANPNAMFGEQHWPALADRELVFVVEGAINGLALEAELPGIYVAATAGSELRPLYGTKLSTWKRVCLMTDPDEAGDRLADSISSSLARHASYFRLRLGEGYDPAKLREEEPGRLGAIVRACLMRTTSSPR